ncbi:hypothetical protein CDD83_3185 [Cordyceps sp. RAO-2017]|nr:hypothetical protein CDD83_3185 [Cordyceps sp. RAO-2017]
MGAILPVSSHSTLAAPTRFGQGPSATECPDPSSTFFAFFCLITVFLALEAPADTVASSHHRHLRATRNPGVGAKGQPVGTEEPLRPGLPTWVLFDDGRTRRRPPADDDDGLQTTQPEPVCPSRPAEIGGGARPASEQINRQGPRAPVADVAATAIVAVDRQPVPGPVFVPTADERRRARRPPLCYLPSTPSPSDLALLSFPRPPETSHSAGLQIALGSLQQPCNSPPHRPRADAFTSQPAAHGPHSSQLTAHTARSSQLTQLTAYSSQLAAHSPQDAARTRRPLACSVLSPARHLQSSLLVTDDVAAHGRGCCGALRCYCSGSLVPPIPPSLLARRPPSSSSVVDASVKCARLCLVHPLRSVLLPP